MSGNASSLVVGGQNGGLGQSYCSLVGGDGEVVFSELGVDSSQVQVGPGVVGVELDSPLEVANG